MKQQHDRKASWKLFALIASASTVLSLMFSHPADADGPGVLNCPDTAMCGTDLGPVTCHDGSSGNAPSDCNSFCLNSIQNVGTVCATFDNNLCIQAVCGSAGECGNPQLYVPASCDDGSACTIDTCDPCANNCSGACVHQPDITALSSGPVTCRDGRRVAAPFNCNSLCGDLSQDLGMLCATFDNNPCIEAVCGSAGECGNAKAYVPPSCNDGNPCTTNSCDACANDGAGACVFPPDLSAPGCNLPPGDSCTDGFQCTSTFCADGVCCNRACTDPSETCNLPGAAGECVVRAPVVSQRGIVMSGCVLAAVGVWSLRRALRRART